MAQITRSHTRFAALFCLLLMLAGACAGTADPEQIADEIEKLQSGTEPPQASSVSAVDLGLSVLWASCNLTSDGFAESPYEYGDYFSWGESEPKNNYEWSSYGMGTDPAGPFTKYNKMNSQNPVILETGPDGDDAASKILGGDWRMPTDEEWAELRNNCTWTWTTENNIRGIRVLAQNDSSIFLAAGGGDAAFYINSACYYWSSTLSTVSTCYAWSVISYDNGPVNRGYDNRCAGFAIRPVKE